MDDVGPLPAIADSMHGIINRHNTKKTPKILITKHRFSRGKVNIDSFIYHDDMFPLWRRKPVTHPAGNAVFQQQQSWADFPMDILRPDGRTHFAH
jgi:hypothetical protein